jgi:agmatinase
VPRYVPEDSLQSPRFTGPSTFARLPYVRTLDEVDVAVVGVPFDTGVTYRVGGRFGPNAVRAASVMLRPYNANLDVKPFDVLSCVDHGDVSIVPG